ncbi:MAG: exodeoxyribonuclease VII small subunit [Fibrobacter sp.]|jgi:exodeoxyribonuclease VII small subunit|nr:exodeoxyribonuclease VII small subunit [Fibrobacter sp.]
MKENRISKKVLKPAVGEPLSVLSFEQSLEELERIIEELEREDLSLEDALRYFEQGIGMIRTCDSQLKSAQGRLTELFKGENGQFMEKVLGLTLESFLSGDNSDE